MNRSALLSVGLLVLSTSACTASATGTSIPSRCEAIEVDPMRELVVTDPGVVGDPRFGFARVMGAVLGPQGDASARAWMDAWSAMPGEASLGTEVTAPWAAASTRGLDLARAPFELVAIVDRVDLAMLGRAPELRFVYGLVTDGARRPLTVAVELQLPPTQTPPEWAAQFHALGSLTGDASGEALAAIVSSALAEPLHGQVRTQDGRGRVPTLYEFDLRDGAPLVPSSLFNQPAAGVSAADLAAFVSANEQAVTADEDVLPGSMLAPFVAATPPHFDLPGVPADVTSAFANTTCNGCHTAEPTLDGAFHISPLRRGEDALSPFLVGTNGQPDELSRREDVLRGLLCQD